MSTPTPLSRRIARRLNAEIVAAGWKVDPARCIIRRTHVGRHQRAAGAWTWELTDLDGGPPQPLQAYVGSIFRAREIAAAPRIDWLDNCGHIELCPDRGKGNTRRQGPRRRPSRWKPPPPGQDW